MNLFHNVKMTIQGLAVIITEQEIGEENIEEKVEKGGREEEGKDSRKVRLSCCFPLDWAFRFVCVLLFLYLCYHYLFLSL